MEEAVLHTQKCPTLAQHSCFANVGASTSSGSTSSSSNPQSKKCLKLKPDEQKLLADNNGCFKCRCFNQSHGVHSCPNDFSDGNKYQKIMPHRDAAGNVPRSYRDAAKNIGLSKGKTVASITTAAAEDIRKNTFALEPCRTDQKFG